MNNKNKIFNIFGLRVRLLKLPELYINKILSRRLLQLIFRKKKKFLKTAKKFLGQKRFELKISKSCNKIIRSRDNSNIKKIQRRRLYLIISLNLKILLKTSKNAEN